MMADRTSIRLGAGYVMVLQPHVVDSHDNACVWRSGGYGLHLDDELWHGTSQRCETFNNHPICADVDILTQPLPPLEELQARYGIVPGAAIDYDDSIEEARSPPPTASPAAASCSVSGTTAAATTLGTSTTATTSDQATPGNGDELYRVMAFESMNVELYGFH